MSADRLNFVSFLSKLQKKSTPEHTCTRTTMDSLNGFLHLVCEKTLEYISTLKRTTGKVTTDAATVQTALKLLLPPALAQYTISHATKTVMQYHKNEVAEKEKKLSEAATGGAVKADPRLSRSVKAGLTLPISRVDRCLKRVSTRVSSEAAVFLTAALEFLANEMLTLGAEVTSASHRKKVSVEDLTRSVFGDREIPAQLVKKSSKRKAGADDKETGGEPKVKIYGDADVQALAKKINWGAVRYGWKGVYTDSMSSRKRQKTETKTESGNVSANVPDATAVPVAVPSPMDATAAPPAAPPAATPAPVTASA